MSDDAITLHERTAHQNWPRGIPEWADEGARLYTGFVLQVATREWRQIVTTFDGSATTAYLTASGFDTEHHGPAVEAIKGERAAHRKVMRKFFRESYNKEVAFA